MPYIEIMQKRTYTNFNTLRLAHQCMAQQIQPKLFLTLVTNSTMGIEQMKRKTKEFLARMDEHMLGRNWSKALVSQRMDGLLYVEHEYTNIHVHGLMTKPYQHDADLQAIADDIWAVLCPSGSVVIKDIGDVEKRSEYCTKEAGIPHFFERQFFMAQEFMAAAA